MLLLQDNLPTLHMRHRHLSGAVQNCRAQFIPARAGQSAAAYRSQLLGKVRLASFVAVIQQVLLQRLPRARQVSAHPNSASSALLAGEANVRAGRHMRQGEDQFHHRVRGAATGAMKRQQERSD